MSDRGVGGSVAFGPWNRGRCAAPGGASPAWAVAFLAACAGALPVPPAEATPIRALGQFASVTVWERTGGSGPLAITMFASDSRLITRRANPLGTGNSDFYQTSLELYDVFFSDRTGNPNPDGDHLTIEAQYGGAADAGMNIAEVSINFSNATSEAGLNIASYVAGSRNAYPSSVGACLDGLLHTHTAMGGTTGATQRMRITVGFLSSSGPPAAAPALITAAVALPEQVVLDVSNLVSAVSNWVERAAAPHSAVWEERGSFMSHHGWHTWTGAAPESAPGVYRVRSAGTGP